MKGTSATGLRKLVKDGVSGCKYLINTNPYLPVLLISTHSGLEAARAKEVAAEKTARHAESMKAIQALVVFMMNQGRHIRMRHQDVTSLVLPPDRKTGVPLTEGAPESV